MAKTVGCSDFNEPCSFRITADDGEENMMVDVATAHAMKRHPYFADSEQVFRSSIRAEIKNLMAQAHMTPAEITDSLK